MKKFNNWRDIKDWAEEHGYHNMAKRMQMNNDYWMSSGEFGRNQVAICDAMRFAKTEAERHEIAKNYNEATAENFGLY